MAFFVDEKYNTKLYYEVIGEGEPFLLVHGWAIDHKFLMNAMEPAFAMSGRSFKRIYVDVPGMGQSEPGLVKNGDGVVEVLIHFMEKICPGESFYIGGNSFGAAVCRAVLVKYGAHVKGAALIVPSNGAGESKVPKNGCFKKDETFLASLSEKERKDFCMMNANLTKESWNRFRALAYPSVLGNDSNEFLHKTFKGSFSYDVGSGLKKRPFTEPVLILAAKYDTAVGYEAQFEWLAHFPKATYAVLDGAGHNVHIDQPELFTHTVAGWLAGLGH